MKLHLFLRLTLTIKVVLGSVVPGTDPVNPCKTCCQGPTGSAGSPGNNGNNGSPGRDGFPGSPGNKGERGDVGLPGSTGLVGPPAPRGPIGDRGDTGLRGFPGKVGPVGVRGLSGLNGTDGRDGMPGRVGVKGQKGEVGRANSRSAFMVLKSNSQTASASGETVDFKFVQTNIGNHFDINTDRFTCQIPGVYFFNYHGHLVNAASSNNALELMLMKNGATVVTARTVASNSMAAASGTLALAAGDQIWINLDDPGERLDCYANKDCAFNGFLLYEN